MTAARYRAIPLHGVNGTLQGKLENPDARAHGVQAGGSGGRIIGDGWRLNRLEAERMAEELERAYQDGCHSAP